MSDYVVSLIRTWVPVACGAIIAWLAARGLNLDPSVSAWAIPALTGGITAAWYALARAGEAKYPWLGILLGHTAQPSYGKAGK